jgi:hypothetical protein
MNLVSIFGWKNKEFSYQERIALLKEYKDELEKEGQG